MTFEKLQWIATSCISQKWYERACRGQLRTEVRPIPVETFGFKAGRRTTEITGAIRQVLHAAWAFSGTSVFIASLD
eukprot:6936479-Pyramimonas_sp.AAC.1